jgi:hypothetical protein
MEAVECCMIFSMSVHNNFKLLVGKSRFVVVAVHPLTTSLAMGLQLMAKSDRKNLLSSNRA